MKDFDFGPDIVLTCEEVLDVRKHESMREYFDNIGKRAIFEHDDDRIGTITNVGEDSHDYWIEVVYADGSKVLESPLTHYQLVECTDSEYQMYDKAWLLIQKAFKSNRYGIVEIYSAFNEIFNVNESMQENINKLMRKFNEIKSWHERCIEHIKNK